MVLSRADNAEVKGHIEIFRCFHGINLSVFEVITRKKSDYFSPISWTFSHEMVLLPISQFRKAFLYALLAWILEKSQVLLSACGLLSLFFML